MYGLRTLFLLAGSLSCLVSPTLQSPIRDQEPLLPPSRFEISKESARTNANSIFNAIHSSMRQWGSSLQHNGMSFFLASIPEGVMLYHGTHTPDRVTGIEWLAFEIEHAENFARQRRPRGPGRSPPGKNPGYGPPGMPPPRFSEEVFCEDDGTYEVDDTEGQPGGNLHMYRTNRPINRLLYIDGMSAAKTNLGTLDTQDILLLNFTGGSRGMFGERERAELLCKWGKRYDIEGYIRTEAGIEIIWCDFEIGLDFVSHNQRPSEGSLESDNAIGLLEYYRAMSARYHSITASRVSIDYSSMVSAYFYTMNLTDPNGSKLPRLLESSDHELLTVKVDLENVMSRKTSSSVDWQGVVDMIVSRYNTRLPYLTTKATKVTFRSEVNTLLNVFIDYNATSIDSGIKQCTEHYLQAAAPSTREDFLVLTALEEVSGRICKTLFKSRALVLESTGKDLPDEAVQPLKELMEWLDWTDWKSCGACASDEVCVVAVWPFGTVEDHNHPSCQNSSQIRAGRGGGGYWQR